MVNFTRLLKFRRETSQWENLTSSIGEERGIVGKGRHTCWEAVGPVREAWRRLGPEIKNLIENSGIYGPDLSLEIYMIGHTKDKAAPKILICSTDAMARKMVRRNIKESGIMNNYPAIGLGDTSKFPDLLAQEDIEPTSLLNSNLCGEIVVLSPPSDNAFGRSLFVHRRDGGLRRATAGPILHIGDMICQLTVGHAFWEVDQFAPNETQSSSWDDCDFDGQSDIEDDDAYAELGVPDKGNPAVQNMPIHNNCGPVATGIAAKLQDPSSPDPKPSLTEGFPSDVDLSATCVSSGADKTQATDPAVPLILDRIGKLALHSETGTKQSLDYALVELEGSYRNGINEVAYGEHSIQMWLRVRQAAKIGLENVNIITMTASSKFLSGKLCATASYLRLPGQRTLQELYSVRLGGKLADGDCGSGVIDQIAGHLYGHIVAGSVGTGHAYIVPATQVFEDISDRLGEDVTLVPPEKPTLVSPKKPTRLTHYLRDRTEEEPLRVVEFASKRYFNQLMQPSQADEDENNAIKSAHTTPTPAVPFISPTQCDRAIYGVPRQPQQQDSLRWPMSPDPMSGFPSKASIIQSKTPTSNWRGKVKSKERNDSGHRKSFAFEQRFFALPSDLQVQIISSLGAPDILNLRIVSRNWYSLIMLNEAPISRAFLEHSPIPGFVIRLYPPPNPSEINLHYICGLWHRLFVASKLSALMSEWLTKDIFLRKAEAERLEFSPRQDRMRRRLIPLLFTIFHFFETYRNLHLKYVLEHCHGLLRAAGTINTIELQIMSMYDDMTLLQVHQVYPLLTSFLRRKLRPPSYLGLLERPLRGYGKDPPPDHIHVAILCIGGLREVVRFLEIEVYDARRTAVDNWYSSVSHEPINSKSQPYRRLMGMGRRESRRTFLSTAERRIGNTTSTSGGLLSPSGLGDGHHGRTGSSYGGSLVCNTSLAAGPPMGPLALEHTQLLLPYLPVLEQIWLPTAEPLLLARRAVGRRQDIKKNAEVMLELICEGITDADELFYEQASRDDVKSRELTG